MDSDVHAVMARADKKIWSFCTSLFRSVGAGAPVSYCGSATFVRVGERRCLLTAAHVWELYTLEEDDDEAIVRDTYSQLSLVIDDGRPAVTVLRGAMTCLYGLPKRGQAWTEWGPDIALVELPRAYADQVEAAGKTFYNLTKRRPEALATRVRWDSGLWIVAAAPGEFVTSEGRQSDGAERFDVGRVVLSTTVRAAPTHGGLDYLDLALHDKRDTGFPCQWNGLSGAGVWRVGESGDGKLTWDGETVALEGVLFWWDPRNDLPEEEFLRAHGRRTIYEHLLGPLSTVS